MIRGLTIASWSWQQQAGGVEVSLTGADTATPTFTMPDTRAPLVFGLTATARDGRVFRAITTLAVAADVDGNGLIEIYNLLDLHNMRYNLAGTSYKTSDVPVPADTEENSSGCPAQDEGGCRGYELMQDLDFDGDGDGRTWSSLGSGDGDAGYTLDPGDSQADYFRVANGTGGWEPIGDGSSPFTAVFDGNGHSIRNLAIRRAQQYIGLFGAIDGEAAIGNLGLIDNLADYTGSSDESTYIGGLVGRQEGGSIRASHATGPAAGGNSNNDDVGGLVGIMEGGSITASYATGPVDGGNGTKDSVGGLVGWQEGGVITTSYATDRVGGLVGRGRRGATPPPAVGDRIGSAGWWAITARRAAPSAGMAMGMIGLAGWWVFRGKAV